ncbi:MAG: LPS export ABC transporter permease LptF [Alphaproteobacteria bacterium]|nr:LPS export ABC transporter permease LptF [Alphaproteobacteria bacterium]
MKKLNIYIANQIFIGFLLVTFSLMSILWLTQSLRFIEMITNKGLPISLFIKMTSCLMPRLYAILSPISLFVAVLFVYNRMLSDRELVVIKSAGISPWQSAKPALFMGILVSLFAVYVNNVATPSAEKKFQDLEWQVKNDVSHLMFREGEFTTLSNNLTVFITSHKKDGSVEGVMINDERNPKVKVTVAAESGIIIYTEQGPRIVLINGIRQEVNNQTSQFSSLSFDRYSVDFGASQNKRRKAASARSRTLTELLNASSNPNLSPAEARRYIVEGHRRLINPFYNFVMSLLACVGLLVGNFNRRGQGKIISFSILLMVMIQANDLIFGNLSTKNLYFLTLFYANIILPTIIGFWFLFFYNPTWIARLGKKEEFPK